MTVQEYDIKVGDHFYNRSLLRYNSGNIPKNTTCCVTSIEVVFCSNGYLSEIIHFEYYDGQNRFENFFHKNSPYSMKCIVCTRDVNLRDLFGI